MIGDNKLLLGLLLLGHIACTECTDATSCYSYSVVLDHSMSLTKTDEAIEMPFGADAGGHKEPCI